MTPLERRCRLLLHAYPAWYRRERAGEMLDTLLEASPPGRRWPSLRDSRSLVRGGLRVRGVVVWCLSVLWAGLGAAGAGYVFILSLHVPAIPTYSRIPCWVGEPGVVIAAAELGGAVWLVLTIPVLVAGLVRLRGGGLSAGAWACAWVAGIALMFPVADWQTSAPAVASIPLGLSEPKGTSRVPLSIGTETSRFLPLRKLIRAWLGRAFSALAPCASPYRYTWGQPHLATTSFGSDTTDSKVLPRSRTTNILDK